MKLIIKIIILFTFLSFHNSGFSLSNDKNQPADIESDEVDVDFKTGKRTFIGNVRFVQGTLRVKADRIDALFKNGKLAKATAYGAPAAFRQRPDGKDADVEGKGKVIVMNQVKNTLTLKKQASLKQGFDVAKGEHIFYNMANDRLKVQGNAGASNAKKSTPPKTQTDSFFQEPTNKEPASTVATPSTSKNTQMVKSSADNTSTSDPNTTELPEKIVLPGQSTAKKKNKNNGRSRLIILPKSK